MGGAGGPLRDGCEIKSDVGREVGGHWLSSQLRPSPPHLGEPGRSMWWSPASHQMAPWKTRTAKASLQKDLSRRHRGVWGSNQLKRAAPPRTIATPQSSALCSVLNLRSFGFVMYSLI